MKSALEMRVFRESLAMQCITQITEVPMNIKQGKPVSASYLTKRSYQIGQSHGLDWIDNLETLDEKEFENLIRARLRVEKKYLTEQVEVIPQIQQTVSGVCDSLIGTVIDFIFSVYMELEKRVAEERVSTGFNGPCDSLQDVRSLGLISALHWMLDEV